MKTFPTLTGVMACAIALTVPAVADDDPAVPFIGQVQTFAFDFCPDGWYAADGRVLSVTSDRAVLFEYIGATFGGNGTSTFALPDLNRRFASGVGTGTGLSAVTLGQEYGHSNPTLTEANLPAHTHTFQATSNAGDSADPLGRTVGTFDSAQAYAAAGQGLVKMAADSVGNSGGGSGPNVRDPYLAVKFCIAYEGTPPPRP